MWINKLAGESKLKYSKTYLNTDYKTEKEIRTRKQAATIFWQKVKNDGITKAKANFINIDLAMCYLVTLVVCHMVTLVVCYMVLE